MMRHALTALALLGLLVSHTAAALDGVIHGKIRADVYTNLCLGVAQVPGAVAIATDCDNPYPGYTTNLRYGPHATQSYKQVVCGGQYCLFENGTDSLLYSSYEWGTNHTHIDLDEPFLRIGNQCVDREGINQPVHYIPCSSYTGIQMHWYMGWPLGVVIETDNDHGEPSSSPEPFALLGIQESQWGWRLLGHRTTFADNSANTKFFLYCGNGLWEVELDPNWNLAQKMENPSPPSDPFTTSVRMEGIIGGAWYGPYMKITGDVVTGPLYATCNHLGE
ncbi:MAG: hypothetical protein R3330_16535 [Saprospiraceae bacterium]|nr:hypothetical protein [Saprospiraceae bacterium]